MLLEIIYKVQIFSQAKHKNWTSDLAFLVGITGRLDNINVFLQGKALGNTWITYSCRRF